MSRLTDLFTAFFSKDRVKKLEAIGKTIITMFFSKWGEQLWNMITSSVIRAEDSGKPGTEKFATVYAETLAFMRDPKSYRWAIHMLVSIAVGYFKAQIEESKLGNT